MLNLCARIFSNFISRNRSHFSWFLHDNLVVELPPPPPPPLTAFDVVFRRSRFNSFLLCLLLDLDVDLYGLSM